MDKCRLQIAVTPQDVFPGEALWIKTILDAGWDYVHLRHPGATLREVKAVIESLPVGMHSRLRLHGHFELVNEFNLGGIHLNSRCPATPALYRGSVSRTCHSVDEAVAHSHNVDYVTLSPIFPSISKPGYEGRFSREELLTLPAGKVVALGGVTPGRIKELSGLPFAGYAVLGYLSEASSADDLKKRLSEFERQ